MSETAASAGHRGRTARDRDHCFAHPHKPAVAKVYMHDYACNAHYLFVCHNCAANHRRYDHRVEPV